MPSLVLNHLFLPRSESISLVRIAAQIAALLIGLGVAADLHAEPLDTMSAAERRATGIDRLTAAERAALNLWLSEQLAPPETAADTATTFESTVSPSDNDDADARREAAIDAEVARRVSAELQAARAADEAVDASEPFEATIIGEFSGWSGKTVFTLNNGQVWRQRHGSRYRYTGADRRVRFEQNVFGLWEMTVLATGRSVGVRRID